MVCQETKMHIAIEQSLKYHHIAMRIVTGIPSTKLKYCSMCHFGNIYIDIYSQFRCYRYICTYIGMENNYFNAHFVCYCFLSLLENNRTMTFKMPFK